MQVTEASIVFQPSCTPWREHFEHAGGNGEGAGGMEMMPDG